MKHGPVKVKSRETLTPTQSAQEALDIERERFHSSASRRLPLQQ